MPTRRRAGALATTPDRTAGLDDWGPPPAPAAAPLPSVDEPADTTSTADTSGQDTDAASEALPARRARPTTAQTSPEPAVPAGPNRPISARIPVSLFAAVNEARTESGQTHEMWFLTALNAAWDQLEAEYPPAPKATKVPLRDRRSRRPAGEPLVQYPLRLTADERAALDDRYRTCRPSSMADLVTTIVRIGLAARAPG